LPSQKMIPIGTRGGSHGGKAAAGKGEDDHGSPLPPRPATMPVVPRPGVTVRYQFSGVPSVERVPTGAPTRANRPR
jgi:hypothetical protein